MKLPKWLTVPLLVLVLGPLILAGGCTYPSNTLRGTLKIGLVAPFSGPSSAVGYNMLFATKLAIKEWNESDRLRGYRIELIAQDDRNDAALGLTQARKMVIDRDVIGVAGHPSNASALSAAETYSTAGLAMISTEATSNMLPGGQYRGVFRLAASESLVLSDTVRFLTSTLKARRLAIVTDPSQEYIKFSSGLAEAVRKGGLSVALGDSLKSEQVDFSEMARRVAASDSQAVVFRGDYLSAASLLSQMRQQKANSSYLVAMGSLNPLFLRVAGNSAEGSYVLSLAPNPTDVPAAQGFVQAYRAMAGTDPLPSALLSYDATNILLTALQRNLEDGREPDRLAIARLVRDTQNYAGLSSAVTFDDTGANTKSKVYFYRVAGLRFPGDRQGTVD